MADIYVIAHLVSHASAYNGRTEPQQHLYGCENLEISREWRHKDSVLKSPEVKEAQG
jgi:hypothetical protein